MAFAPRPSGELEPVDVTAPQSPAGWYSGDTHEHVQYCDQTLHPLEEILARMDAEDLNVANVLIWERAQLPFTAFVCRVTGLRDPLSTTFRMLQYGVETSGLDCAKWGHLIGLGIGPNQARIARGMLVEKACAEMAGLGLQGDGTGQLVAPVAQHFLTQPGAVCGYAHTVWATGLYHPDGYDWSAQLRATAVTTDARFLDPAQHLSVPDVPRLMGLVPASPSLRAFYPLLAAMDAVLGNVQFIETVIVADEIPVITTPPSHWREMVFKLLTAGVRIAQAGGTDRACLTGLASFGFPRTWTLTDRPLTPRAWREALAAGRCSISAGALAFLRLTLDGEEAGSQVDLASPAQATAAVELHAAEALDDTIELVVNGAVLDSRPVVLAAAGSTRVVFDDVPFPKSGWVVARLGSERAQTGSLYVIVDGRPIADPTTAEYWMVWCDIVTRTNLDHPERQFFGDQEDEALALIAQARRAFQCYRDIGGFDPAWEVTRYGSSTAGARGPISIGTTGPIVAGQPRILTCVNAPPQSSGSLVLSRADDPAGTCDGEIRSFVDLAPGSVIGTHPAQSTRSGYAEVLVPPVPAGTATVFAQFVWTNPPGLERVGCGGGPSSRSASDALRLVVQ